MKDYRICGNVHKYGDNINTDLIIPAQYMELPYADMAVHAMEGLDQDFVKKVRPGDILVAGKNFGSGSSREMAPIALKYAGIGAIVAEEFARIFYRNAINIGLPVVELPEARELCNSDEIEIDLLQGTINNKTLQKGYRFASLPEHLLELIGAGGLKALLLKKSAKNG
jgi:3-isopropylmalate dehydratase small subunit